MKVGMVSSKKLSSKNLTARHYLKTRETRDMKKDELVGFVRKLRLYFYAVPVGNSGAYLWDIDKEVNGGDLVEKLVQLFEEYDLVPKVDGSPCDDKTSKT